jgi:PleD family two-component response regulator
VLAAGDSAKSLLERADRALNQAKLDGRNCVRD